MLDFRGVMGLIIKGPPSQGFSHHFPHDFFFVERQPRPSDFGRDLWGICGKFLGRDH